MPQTVTITKTLFSFDELNDEAKEKARDWYRSVLDNSDFDCETSEFADICAKIGIDLDTHEVRLHGGGVRYEPNLWWSLSYSQGDGACFEGVYTYRADAALKLREINNDEDWTPLKVAIGLAQVQCENHFGLRAVIKKTSHHYSHENTVDIDVTDERDEDREVRPADVQIIEDRLRDLMRYFHSQLRSQDEYLNSDEAVEESIRANEYTFDEEGNRDD